VGRILMFGAQPCHDGLGFGAVRYRMDKTQKTAFLYN
jgi:hypothetical protein